MKHFGAGVSPEQIKAVPFEIDIWRKRDGKWVTETYEFTARPRFHGADMAALTSSEHDGQGEALLKAIAKTMDDTDGVPLAWRAVAMSRSLAEAVPGVREESGGWAENGVEVDDGGEPVYLDPEGEPHEFTDTDTLERLQSFEAGSSARRWDQLMFQMPDVTVNFDILTGILKYLLAEAGKDRGTGRSR